MLELKDFYRNSIFSSFRKQGLIMQVFLTEGEFLTSPATIKENRRGYRVKVKSSDQTYFVWAKTPLEAEGLVAEALGLMAVTSYTRREMRHHTDGDIDPKLLKIIMDLPPQQQAKLRAIIKHDFRDG